MAYFWFIKKSKYIHEILNNRLQKIYRFTFQKLADQFSNSTEDLNDFKQTILNKVSLPEIQDE